MNGLGLRVPGLRGKLRLCHLRVPVQRGVHGEFRDIIGFRAHGLA